MTTLNTAPNASKTDSLNTPTFYQTYGDPLEAASSFVTDGSMLPEGFRDIQVWRDFADSIDEVMGKNAGALIRDLIGLGEIRYVTNSPTIDREMLLRSAARIGLAVGDLNVFNDKDIKNFIRYTPEFWKEKGCRNFIDYMSFVINALLTLKYLWSQDYDLFVPEGSPSIGTPVYEGGTWYPTSHVYVVYDASKFQSTVNPNFTSQQALSRFFYSIAPIHLVIKSFLVSIPFTTERLNFAASIQIRVWGSTTGNEPKLPSAYLPNPAERITETGLLRITEDGINTRGIE